MAGNVDLRYTCGNLRHAWDFYTPPRPGPTSLDEDVVHLRCLRCSTVRVDVYDSDGALVRRRYFYPEGYRRKKDERPTTQELRKWMARRYRGYREQQMRHA